MQAPLDRIVAQVGSLHLKIGLYALLVTEPSFGPLKNPKYELSQLSSHLLIHAADQVIAKCD